MNNNVLFIKPHHFLDYLYDLGINFLHIGEENINHNNNAKLCYEFIDGKFDTIIFTPFVDDICAPCLKLVDNKCTDLFDEVTTGKYGTCSKNDFNYQLDIKLNNALPNIFIFDKEQKMIDVLKALKDTLTEEIIKLYLWERESRPLNTFIGLDKAINIYSCKNI